ncbi:MAG: hypothetical protein KDB69_01885, partial [Acidimicrobiia bacterium]|nr:hypothetical protein [Acidimicrobiia bacterium]
AESKIDDARGTIEDLNDELEERCADIDDEWQDKAETIDTLDVGLESDDITVDEIRVVWIRR